MHHTSRMLYRERVLPGPTILLLGLGLFLMVGVAYSAAFGSLIGIALGLISGAIYFIFAVTTAPQIRVDVFDGRAVLTAGRASVDLATIGSAQELSHEQRLDVSRGVRNDTAFSIIKGKLPVIELEISDPLDPHGHWCLSSRSPDKLIQAIDSARGPQGH